MPAIVDGQVVVRLLGLLFLAADSVDSIQGEREPLFHLGSCRQFQEVLVSAVCGNRRFLERSSVDGTQGEPVTTYWRGGGVSRK